MDINDEVNQGFIRKSTQDNIIEARSGLVGLGISVFLFLLAGGMTGIAFAVGGKEPSIPCLVLAGVSIILFLINNMGFFTIEPNEAVLLSYYGKYIGTVKENGFFWINPFTEKIKISLKAKNLNGEMIKVTDKDGNPIEIAVVIVWKINDTAKATYDVEDYNEFIKVNSESAIRHLASSYKYDTVNDNEPSLRGQHPEVFNTLLRELKDKTKDAGIEILDAKITHLTYAPEIASSMLRRQQAEATIQARQKIVHGACGIVRDSINSLTNMEINLNDDQKANLVTNLLVVMCSESNANPVVNTGSSA